MKYFTRLAPVVMMLVLVVLMVEPPMAAQDATPDTGSATPAATPAPAAEIDLAALTLRPADLATVGLNNFGMANLSSLRDAEAEAIVSSAGDPLEAADRLNLYQLAGFQQRYVGSMLRPQIPFVRLPSGLIAGDERVISAITQYETPSAAELAFSVLEGSLDDAGLDIPGTRSFGDESDLTRSTGVDEASGNVAQRLELAFRDGNLLAEVAIINYVNQEPVVEDIEALGGLLLARIKDWTEHPAPDLSERVLRLTPLVTWIDRNRVRDFYIRLDSERIPTFDQIAAAIREGLTFEEMATPTPARGTVLPRSTYMYWTPVGDGDPIELPLYVVWIDRYEGSGQAGAALHAVTPNLGLAYTNVREFMISDDLGDESRAFAYTYEGDPSGPAYGHVVMSRVGDTIVRMQVDGPEGVRRTGVVELARLQVDCVQSLDNCPPLPATEALAALLAPAPLPSGEDVPGVSDTAGTPVA